MKPYKEVQHQKDFHFSCSIDSLLLNPNMASKHSSCEATRRNDEELRIVMVGKTGVGKSATGNTILGRNCFKSKFSTTSMTDECSKAKVDGQKVAVIDTPGLFNTRWAQDKTHKVIGQCICHSSPGPHVFLVVVMLGRFTEEEKQTVQKIREMFGQDADKYSMVLFTHGDLLKNTTIEELMKGSPDLQELVARCNGQYHVFNNNLENRSQVTKLLKKIRTIVQKNGGSHYTNEMFQEAERAIEEEKQRILKEKEEEIRILKEKEEQKYKERKQLEMNLRAEYEEIKTITEKLQAEIEEERRERKRVEQDIIDLKRETERKMKEMEMARFRDRKEMEHMKRDRNEDDGEAMEKQQIDLEKRELDMKKEWVKKKEESKECETKREEERKEMEKRKEEERKECETKREEERKAMEKRKEEERKMIEQLKAEHERVLKEQTKKLEEKYEKQAREEAETVVDPD